MGDLRAFLVAAQGVARQGPGGRRAEGGLHQNRPPVTGLGYSAGLFGLVVVFGKLSLDV